MKRIIAVAGLIALSGCTASQVTTANLFCAKSTTDGPLIVALANDLGAPVVVTGLASTTVAADCAAINAIPVTPPANPTTAPVVAAKLPAS